MALSAKRVTSSEPCLRLVLNAAQKSSPGGELGWAHFFFLKNVFPRSLGRTPSILSSATKRSYLPDKAKTCQYLAAGPFRYSKAVDNVRRSCVQLSSSVRIYPSLDHYACRWLSSFLQHSQRNGLKCGSAALLGIEATNSAQVSRRLQPPNDLNDGKCRNPQMDLKDIDQDRGQECCQISGSHTGG
jgi:hypothetical protein